MEFDLYGNIPTEELLDLLELQEKERQKISELPTERIFLEDRIGDKDARICST